MNGERHFKGTLSFALAHTQACYKDSEPFTIFTYRVFFFFLISVAYNVNKQGKPLYVAITARSISGTSKNIKKNYTKLYCHFGRKITVHNLSVYQYTFLLCVNTAKDI